MAASEIKITPYGGGEPYLHLCFADASARRVRALLTRLRARGVRVWYAEGNPADRAERAYRDARMLEADLTVVYLDEAFRGDPAAKSRLLACQRAGQRIVCLNTDGGDSGLSIGLHADAVEIVPDRNGGAEAAERALLRADGFSQELIGEPERAKRSRVRILTAVAAALAALLAACCIAWVLWIGPKQAAEQAARADEVTFADETVREAVRSALGGGTITEERLNAVTTLLLPGDALPEDLSDLARLPALETVALTQSAAKDAPAHPELFAYTVELIGGDTP